jgi:hypothetical protein
MTDGEGRTVVRAVVHARLLGIRLLSLDAQVLIGPAAWTPTADRAFHPTESALVPADGAGYVLPPARVAGRGVGASNGSTAGLARATELLAEGSAALSRSRRDAVRTG